MTKGQLLYIITDWSGRPDKTISGCSYYRLTQPAEALNKYSKKYDCEVVVGKDLDKFSKGKTGVNWQNLFTRYDAIIIKNVDDISAVAPMIETRNIVGSKVIVDMDDALFDLDKQNVIYNHYRKDIINPKLTCVECLLTWADAVFVENIRLKRYYSEQNTNIFIQPNYIDRDLAMKMKHKWVKRDSDNITILWAGGASHKTDFELYAPVIKDVLEKHKNVTFTLFAPDNMYSLSMFPKDQVKFVPAINDWHQYMEKLNTIGAHIGLIPLARIKFNTYKSACKFYEYTMAGIATIAPAYDDLPYARVIKNNNNGMLYFDGMGLRKGLDILIANPVMRDSLANNAYNDIVEKAAVIDHVADMEAALDAVIG